MKIDEAEVESLGGLSPPERIKHKVLAIGDGIIEIIRKQAAKANSSQA